MVFIRTICTSYNESTSNTIGRKQWVTEISSHVYTLFTVVYQKAPVGLKQHSILKKVKPVALAIVKSCLPEGISQLLSQPVSRKIKLQNF